MVTQLPRLLVVAILVLWSTTSAHGQSDPGTDTLPSAGAVTLEELEDFAVAYLEVRVLRAQHDRQVNRLIAQSGLDRDRLSEIQEEGLSGVPDREAHSFEVLVDRTKAVYERFRGRMVAAVRATDLSVDRFTTISRALNADPDLAVRAQAQIDRILADRAEVLDLDLGQSDSGG
ncbi:MAG: DUF4168 domain-containing protein [Spirochaetota bacterium]